MPQQQHARSKNSMLTTEDKSQNAPPSMSGEQSDLPPEFHKNDIITVRAPLNDITNFQHQQKKFPTLLVPLAPKLHGTSETLNSQIYPLEAPHHVTSPLNSPPTSPTQFSPNVSEIIFQDTHPNLDNSYKKTSSIQPLLYGSSCSKKCPRPNLFLKESKFSPHLVNHPISSIINMASEMFFPIFTNNSPTYPSIHKRPTYRILKLLLRSKSLLLVGISSTFRGKHAEDQEHLLGTNAMLHWNLWLRRRA